MEGLLIEKQKGFEKSRLLLREVAQQANSHALPLYPAPYIFPLGLLSSGLGGFGDWDHGDKGLQMAAGHRLKPHGVRNMRQARGKGGSRRKQSAMWNWQAPKSTAEKPRTSNPT